MLRLSTIRRSPLRRSFLSSPLEGCFYCHDWKTDYFDSSPAPTHRTVKVSAWRCRPAEDNRGILVYFDPYLEDISIRILTVPERADRLVDSPVSVSAMPDAEDDFDYDQLHIELNGS